ncbi:MAG: tRNA (cytidine/uridine-2'-O-)-methyltransferase TrmJ [Candidatus Poribacteria bacterium]|nr:MAG: tRNA (cytidine/uridine-2'-O-)-methyltransferase TrmJ [Candidatus Poribacteria bacterium]
MTQRRMADQLPPDELRALRPQVPENLKNVRTILVEPKEPGNIGSVARALNAMGLSDLWIVRPQTPWRNSSEARKFAMNSLEVLNNAQEVDSLDEAIADLHLLIGTTNRRRMRRLPQPIPAREAAQLIAQVSQEQRVGILYGREDWGLSNEDLARCQVIATIPQAKRNPSLNLAQAVQVFAYEIFLASVGEVPRPPFHRAELRDYEALTHRVLQLLRRVGFRPMNDDWSSIDYALRRVLGRVPLERRDLEVLMKICHDVEEYIERHTPAAPVASESANPCESG